MVTRKRSGGTWSNGAAGTGPPGTGTTIGDARYQSNIASSRWGPDQAVRNRSRTSGVSQPSCHGMALQPAEGPGEIVLRGPPPGTGSTQLVEIGTGGGLRGIVQDGALEAHGVHAVDHDEPGDEVRAGEGRCVRDGGTEVVARPA